MAGTWNPAVNRHLVIAGRATCAYCGGVGNARNGPDGLAWTRDHVRARSRGGEDDPANLVLSCMTCNSRKGAMPADLYRRLMAARMGTGPVVAGMAHDQARALVRYIQTVCYWLDVHAWPVGGVSVVEARLYWPEGHAELISEYRRSVADAAIDRLCDVSEAYFAALRAQPLPA